MLIRNWHGHATVPSRSLYPHQWSWDSAFIAMGLQHFAPRRAAAELLSLFGAQWADGRIPHIAFNPAVADHAYFPGPTFWRSVEVDGCPPIDTSGIIQPPVHAIAAAMVIEGLGNPVRRSRAALPVPGGTERLPATPPKCGAGGLAAAVHPWETGLDNSPAWDAPLHAVHADLALFDTYTRRDVAHAGAGERPTDEDYARYIRLGLAYRDSGYDDDWVRREAEFLVVDPGFNALWAWSELALADIAGSDRGRRRLAPWRRRYGSPPLSPMSCGATIDGLFLAKDERAGGCCRSVRSPASSPWCCRACPTAWWPALRATLAGESFRAVGTGCAGCPAST